MLYDLWVGVSFSSYSLPSKHRVHAELCVPWQLRDTKTRVTLVPVAKWVEPPWDRKVVDSIPSCVEPKTPKFVLAALLLGTQHEEK